MTEQDIIDKAAHIAHRIDAEVGFWDECGEFDSAHGWLVWTVCLNIAQALADAGLLAEPKCQRECEARRDWDALLAERDAAVAKLDQVRHILGSGGALTPDEVYASALAILDGEAQS